MAQSVECLTLDFRSGRDLTVCEFEPHTDNAEACLGFSLPLSLFATSLLVLSLSLKINKNLKTQFKQLKKNK